MLVAPQHVRITVACPHCGQTLDPWRSIGPPTGEVGDASGQGTDVSAQPGYSVYVSTRNRWIAGALAILLGVFGVHRFYLGHFGIGLCQVLLTVCSLGFLYPVVAIWSFIEGILCFVGAMRDVDGLPLSG
jgi:TM2 domain-containing membrane protein YozV